MKSYVFRVALEEEDGTWSAVIPVLPGCGVDAGSPEEALDAVREAAQSYVESLIEESRPIPSYHVPGSELEGAAIVVVAVHPRPQRLIMGSADP
jgi:predicted RNase H-like HicB family nuclease